MTREGQGLPPVSRAWKPDHDRVVLATGSCNDLLIQSNVDADPSAHLDLLSDEYDAECVRSIFV